MKTRGRWFALRIRAVERWMRLLLDEQTAIRVADGGEEQFDLKRIGRIERLVVVVQQAEFIGQQPPNEGSDPPQPAVGNLRHARFARHPIRHEREARRQQIECLARDLRVAQPVFAVAAVADQPLDDLRFARVVVRQPYGCRDEAERWRWGLFREAKRRHQRHDQRRVIGETQRSQYIAIHHAVGLSQQRDRGERLLQRDDACRGEPDLGARRLHQPGDSFDDHVPDRKRFVRDGFQHYRQFRCVGRDRPFNQSVDVCLVPLRQLLPSQMLPRTASAAESLPKVLVVEARGQSHQQRLTRTLGKVSDGKRREECCHNKIPLEENARVAVGCRCFEAVLDWPGILNDPAEKPYSISETIARRETARLGEPASCPPLFPFPRTKPSR